MKINNEEVSHIASRLKRRIVEHEGGHMDLILGVIADLGLEIEIAVKDEQTEEIR